MGLELVNKKEFEKYLEYVKDKAFPEYLIKQLSDYGEMFIRDARTKKSHSDWHRDAKDIVTANKLVGGGSLITPDSPSFNNITTRLRNSIGYVVSQNGVIKKSDFESYAVSGESDEEGRNLGRQYATSISRTLKDYALVCVASTQYAVYVEAKGYDVITGSVLTLKQELLKRW